MGIPVATRSKEVWEGKREKNEIKSERNLKCTGKYEGKEQKKNVQHEASN